MCIVVYSDQPIMIDHMLESLWPKPGPRGIDTFDQHFDLILRNLGKEPVSRLRLIHQRRLYPQPSLSPAKGIYRGFSEPLFSVESESAQPESLYRTFVRKNDSITLEIQATTDRGASRPTDALVIACKELKVTGITCDSLLHNDTALQQYVGDDTGLPTLLEAQLSEPLRPEEQHFVRISFPETLVVPVAVQPIIPVNESGPKKTAVVKHVFDFISPHLIVTNLISQLDRTGLPPQSVEADKIKSSVLSDGLLSANGASHVSDHRMSLVTNRFCSLQAAEIEGSLRKLACRGFGSSPISKWEDVWAWGPAWDAEIDVAVVARNLLDVLIQYKDVGAVPGGGHRLDVLTSISGASGRENTLAVLNALSSFGLVTSNGRLEWQLASKKKARNFVSRDTDRIRMKIMGQLVSEQGRHGARTLPFDCRPFRIRAAVTAVVTGR